MKSKTLVVVTMLAILTIAITGLSFARSNGNEASGKTQSDVTLKANIPFEFEAGNTRLSAGEYTVKFPQQNVLIVSNTDHKSKVNAYVLGIRGESLDPQKETKLVFRRYGEQYFFSACWIEGNNVGSEVIKSRRERSLEKEMEEELAKGKTVKSPAVELVSVVAHIQ